MMLIRTSIRVDASRTLTFSFLLLRKVGDGHSNNDLACTADHMVSIDKLNRVISVDDQALTITVQGIILFLKLTFKRSGLSFKLTKAGSAFNFQN